MLNLLILIGVILLLWNLKDTIVRVVVIVAAFTYLSVATDVPLVVVDFLKDIGVPSMIIDFFEAFFQFFRNLSTKF